MPTNQMPTNQMTRKREKADMMNDRIRISDADREQVAARLREHFAEGRLSTEEMEERISAVFSAKTYGDLRHVMADLPGDAPVAPQSGQSGRSQSGRTPQWGGPGWAGPQWAGPRWVAYRRRPRLFPLMLLALIAALVIPGVGWVFVAFFQFLLVAGLIALLAGVFAAARFRRRIRRQWESGRAVYLNHYSEHGQPS
jgi:hypothetical protein